MHSLYIHIPFCRKACHYCDFHFSTTLKRKTQMVEALCKELILRKKECQTPLQTIYFGGGTPSLLTFDELKKLFNTIETHYPISPLAEITIEVNPDDFTDDIPKKLKQLQQLTINRLSIGIQSFFDEDLLLINRIHNSHQAKKLLQHARAYFDNITIDLIYGIPFMDNHRWEQNIEMALSFNIPHISAYALTVEPKTALNTFIQKGKLPHIDDHKANEQFYLLKDRLENEGFYHYELSNFGKKGYFSRNNTAYWEQKPYIGIGPSAHSYNGKQRSWNIAQNIKYIQSLEHNIRPFEFENLSEKDLYNEFIITRIRTQKGIPLNELKNLFGDNTLNHTLKESEKFLKNNLLTIENQYLKTTRNGLFFSDNIASELLITD